ncbi:MAG: hypothetical protein LBQ55_07060 [Treponema sp.]|jgi:hypothetical protein|nr:hypothetical protein [Treponema sp.]
MRILSFYGRGRAAAALRCAAAALLWRLCLLAVPAAAEPLYSPAWGFRLDLPEGYEYREGDGRNTFSFRSPEGAVFDLAVYQGRYASVEALVNETARRIGSEGDVSYFDYHGKKAALMELEFAGNEGWGLAVELAAPAEGQGGAGSRPGAPPDTPPDTPQGPSKGPPQLLALAYNPRGKTELLALHLSCLDSIAPTGAERLKSGPVTEFGYPRGALKKTPLAGLELEALIAEHDAEGARALVTREFGILRRHLFTPDWQEAWVRFYRMIYRDSWERLADAAFQLERYWNGEPGPAAGGVTSAGTAGLAGSATAAGTAGAGLADGERSRELARKALRWVQGFEYERDLMGSDFVDLVSAVTEGRGDCDSRAMLWAIVLAQANIPSSIMVSREYSHAMGLADIPGAGARFEAGGKQWLVAETTAAVDIGLIGSGVSDIAGWLAVIFE